MTSIIPVKPFGKDLSKPQDLESVVKSDSGKLPAVPSDLSIIPLYDFSNVSCGVDEDSKILTLFNLPFNFYRDGQWKQGVWRKIGLPPEIFTLGGKVQEQTYNGWKRYDENNYASPPYPVIPSLPLFSVIAQALLFLENTGNGVCLAKNALQHAFSYGVYASTAISINSEINKTDISVFHRNGKVKSLGIITTHPLDSFFTITGCSKVYNDKMVCPYLYSCQEYGAVVNAFKEICVGQSFKTELPFDGLDKRFLLGSNMGRIGVTYEPVTTGKATKLAAYFVYANPADFWIT